jgi:hypothetical protein
MKQFFKATKWHTWVGIILSLPIFIVGATAVLIALEKTYKDTESEPILSVGWLPGYSEKAMTKENEMKLNEIKASHLAFDGTQYYGTKSGAITVKNGKATLIPALSGIEVFTIEAVAENIYFGTKMGLYLLSNNQVSKISPIDTRHIDIRKDGSIVLSNNKSLFVSTDNGQNFEEQTDYKALFTSIPKSKTADKMDMSLVPLHKVVMDFHTGKAFFGKAFMDIWIILVGFSCALLSASGIIMWFKKTKNKAVLSNSIN